MMGGGWALILQENLATEPSVTTMDVGWIAKAEIPVARQKKWQVKYFLCNAIPKFNSNEFLLQCFSLCHNVPKYKIQLLVLFTKEFFPIHVFMPYMLSCKDNVKGNTFPLRCFFVVKAGVAFRSSRCLKHSSDVTTTEHLVQAIAWKIVHRIWITFNICKGSVQPFLQKKTKGCLFSYK